MTAVPVTGTDRDNAEESPTLAELDASVGTSPDVPEGEIAVRYYSDEALLAAIRLRHNEPAPSATCWDPTASRSTWSTSPPCAGTSTARPKAAPPRTR